MKKILLAAAAVAATSASAVAQDNVIKVNILSPLVKTGSFFYEHKLNDNSSLQLGLLFTSWKDGGSKVSGFGITPEYRFYLSERSPAPDGFYVAPYLRYQSLKLSDTYPSFNGTAMTTDEATLNTFGGGIVVGRQWIFKRRFSLDVFLGPGYNGGEVTVKSSGSDPETFDPGPFKGFTVRTGITFGIAF